MTVEEREELPGRREERREERERLIVTALLATPVLVLSLIPALQFRNWQWLCFVLAAPVAVWSAWPFHRRALRGATLDTLVSLSVAAAFGWSAYGLFLGDTRDPGFLNAAVVVPLCVLTGRFLAPAQEVADTVARFLVLAAPSVAVTVLGFWLGAGADLRPAVAASVSVLIAACPAALGPAVTTALWAAAERGAQLGLVIHRPQGLEAVRHIDTVVLDTTDTGGYRVVDRLRRSGITPVLATGAPESPAAAVAAGLGIAEVHADCTDTTDLVAQLQQENHRVVVIGDVRGSLEAAEEAVRLDRRTVTTIRLNLMWALASTAVTLPPAAVGLLTPTFAALTTYASCLLVAANSLRLRSWHPSHKRPATTRRIREGVQA